MSTEALYAACLLECGPHKCYGTMPVGQRSLERYTRYYGRVFNWYCVRHLDKPIDGHSADWQRFYTDYIEWVEDTP